MVHFSCRHTRDCINNTAKTLNLKDNIANFPDGLYSETQVQLPTWYFRCLLPLKTVDVVENMKTINGICMFRRDRTTQVISCNPWIARLHTYPSLIRIMMTYLELEGKVSPKPWPQPQTQLQSSASASSQSNNPLTRKTPGPKMADKKRRTRATVKRRYKVRVIAQPIPSTPTLTTPVNSTPTAPTPTVGTTSACGKVGNCIHSSDGIQFGKGKI